MDIVKRFLRPGVFCLFQFGHNDQKLPHLLAHREYPVNLRRYVEEVRALGGIPVLQPLWDATSGMRTAPTTSFWPNTLRR